MLQRVAIRIDYHPATGLGASFPFDSFAVHGREMLMKSTIARYSFLSRWLALGVMVLSLGACGGGGGSGGTAANPGAGSLPVVGTGSYQQNVRILSAAEVQSISVTTNIDANGDTQWTVPASMALAAGQVIVANNVPYQVVSANAQADGLHLVLGRPPISALLSTAEAQGSFDLASMSPNPAPHVTASGFRSLAQPIRASSLLALTAGQISLHPVVYSIPVNVGGVSGTLTATLTGTVDYDYSLSTPIAAVRFNGQVAVTGTLTATASAAGSLTIPIASPTIPFDIGAIPAGITLPLNIIVNANSELKGTWPVNFSQQISVGVSYPSAPTTSNQTTPDTTPLQMSSADLSQFVPCTTLTASVGATVQAGLEFSVTVFDVASLTGNLSYTENVQARLDPRATSPTLASSIGSQLGDSWDGQAGAWPAVDPAKELSDSFSQLLVANAQELMSLAGTSSPGQGIVYGPVTLYSLTQTVVAAPPLPECVKTSPGAISTSGQLISITPDSSASPDSAGLSVVTTVTPPQIGSTPPTPQTVSASNTFDVLTPGVYTITRAATDASGATTTTTEPVPIYPVGSYTGTFSGSLSYGSFTAVVDGSGDITATGTSSNTGSFTATGKIASDGTFTLSGATSGGATFSGGFTPGTNAWTMSGTWSHSPDGGTFTASGG